MGCNSDYMNPTNTEAQFQETAKNLVFVLKKLGKNVQNRLIEASNDQYCKDDYVEQLCAEIKAMSADQLDAIVYNGRVAASRAVATWWDRHQEADRARTQTAEATAKRQAVAAVGLSKLTTEERVALRLFPTEPT